MKTWKSVTLLVMALLLYSCIIKSLQPFYTTENVSFIKSLIGVWTDNREGQWTVESIKDKFDEDQKEGVELSEGDLIFLEAYRDGYFMEYSKKDKGVGFISMPFKIDQQYFLDFIPLEIEDNKINSLAAEHLLKTHSVAKLDINSNNNIQLSWLDESKIEDILNANRMHIKHERVGPQHALLLTARSEELSAFLKKYMKSNIKNKWGKEDKKKNSTNRLTLAKVDAEP